MLQTQLRVPKTPEHGSLKLKNSTSSLITHGVFRRHVSVDSTVVVVVVVCFPRVRVTEVVVMDTKTVFSGVGAVIRVEVTPRQEQALEKRAARLPAQAVAMWSGMLPARLSMGLTVTVRVVVTVWVASGVMVVVTALVTSDHTVGPYGCVMETVTVLEALLAGSC